MSLFHLVGFFENTLLLLLLLLSLTCESGVLNFVEF